MQLQWTICEPGNAIAMNHLQTAKAIMMIPQAQQSTYALLRMALATTMLSTDTQLRPWRPSVFTRENTMNLPQIAKYNRNEPPTNCESDCNDFMSSRRATAKHRPKTWKEASAMHLTNLWKQEKWSSWTHKSKTDKSTGLQIRPWRSPQSARAIAMWQPLRTARCNHT